MGRKAPRVGVPGVRAEEVAAPKVELAMPLVARHTRLRLRMAPRVGVPAGVAARDEVAGEVPAGVTAGVIAEGIVAAGVTAEGVIAEGATAE